MKTTPWDRRPWPWLLLAASLVAYANGLNGDFTYDDKAIIRDNPRIQEWKTSPDLHDALLRRLVSPPRRPIGRSTLLSFAANYLVHGKYPLRIPRGERRAPTSPTRGCCSSLPAPLRGDDGRHRGAPVRGHADPRGSRDVDRGRAEVLARVPPARRLVAADRARRARRTHRAGGLRPLLPGDPDEGERGCSPAFLFLDAMTRETGPFFLAGGGALRRRALFSSPSPFRSPPRSR